MGKLQFEKPFFVFEEAKSQQFLMLQKAGFKRDGLTLNWMTRNMHKAVKLRQYANHDTEVIFKKHFFTDFKLPEEIKYPDHLSPHIFQIESARHMLTRSPAYCADQPGLGKTISAILATNSVPGKTLIICPPYLKYNWTEELAKWCTRLPKIDGSLIRVIENGGVEGYDIPYYSGSDIIIVPDSLIHHENIMEVLRRLKFEWIIVDEAHRFKEPTSQRTKALFEIGERANRLVFMSGTPWPSRPIEMFPIIDQFAPETINHKNIVEYGKEFCAGKEITRFEGNKAIRQWDFNGASNLKQFGKELTEKFMIRHLKKDCLTDLPAKQRQIIFLDQPKKVFKYEKRLLAKYTLEQLMGEDCELGDIASFRRECAMAKLKPASEFIIDQIEKDPKNPIIVFAHHIDMVEGLVKNLAKFKPLMIRGGMTAKQKHQIVKEFQTGRPRPLIGNIDSMGVGLTLTRSKEIIGVEYSWVQGINEQAEDRIHRITQTENVRIRYLVMRNTLDERMLHKVLTTENNVAIAMNQRTETKYAINYD